MHLDGGIIWLLSDWTCGNWTYRYCLQVQFSHVQSFNNHKQSIYPLYYVLDTTICDQGL